MSDRRPQVRDRRPLVWIVDDSRTEALIAQRSLGAGYDFELFVDGSGVVERLAEAGEHPDLVLLDWVMPGMAGDEVCRFLRQHPRTLELPIILITASRTETGDLAKGFAVGATDYVARPFATDELCARVASAIRAKRLSDSAKLERLRLSTVNQLGRALFEAGTDVDQILGELATSLSSSICDGCSILLLPDSSYTASPVTRHRGDPSGAALAAIAALTDPFVHAFASDDDARTKLPPTYGAYITEFGLRSLVILPFGTRDLLRGVVTVTRDRGAEPFDNDDLSTIETCIEYASLAIESALRFDAERIGREQLHTVLTNLPIGVIVTDAARKLSLVNAAARDLLPGAELATDLAGVFHRTEWADRGGAPITEEDTNVLLNQHQRTEVMIRWPGAPAALPVTVSGVALQDGRGATVGSVTLIQDVSAEHAMNAERERTARFQQQMLGIVGHDLRTPLGAIAMGTELLGSLTGDDPEAAATLKRIESSADRMTRMVDQLLDVTRARLGEGIPVIPQTTELVSVVRSVIDELALAHPERRFEIAAASAVVGRWDPDRLAQVVSNVMSNAVQYGRVDAPIVARVDSAAAVARLTVHNVIRDSPIPPAVLATLFDPYRRGVDNGHNSNGLGLGLYIVHEIVVAHGGTISVTSDAGGTTFRVELPVAGPPS